jgi:hypothetical protein
VPNRALTTDLLSHAITSTRGQKQHALPQNNAAGHHGEKKQEHRASQKYQTLARSEIRGWESGEHLSHTFSRSSGTIHSSHLWIDRICSRAFVELYRAWNVRSNQRCANATETCVQERFVFRITTSSSLWCRCVQISGPVPSSSEHGGVSQGGRQPNWGQFPATRESSQAQTTGLISFCCPFSTNI